jgi:hypothetical protein
MSGEKRGYLCVQGWGENTAGVSVSALTAGTGVDSISDASAAANQILGDYSTLNVASGASSAAFTVDLALNPDSAVLDGSVTVALLGLRMTPLEFDTVMRCTMTVGSTTYESAAPIYGQEMNRTLPAASVGHELFGSGVTNLVFHDLPASVLTTGVEFELALDAGDIGSTSVYVGSVFVGLQIPLWLNPDTFTFGSDVSNDRFRSRAGVMYSSSGVLQRTVSFEVVKADLENVHGIGADFYANDVPAPNIFRAAIANIGQPMLFSPYPYPLTDQAWADSVSDVDQRLLSVRQNFFSLYGLLERQLDISVREGSKDLGATYRARMRFVEVC